MTLTPTWVVGRGGLLGQSVERHLNGDQRFQNRPIDWASPHATQVIAREAERFAELAAGRPWRIVWCAGAGIIGTERPELEHETATLRSILDTLDSPGTVFLTSSAGGVFGGATDVPITETSSPAPLSDYGRNKLTQEDLVRSWATDSGGRAVIGRVANLYGPGQRLDKAQGLISQICLATLVRRPISLYVSLDTLRDYLYVDDCSRIVVGCLAAAETLEPGTTITKILATGTSVSIGAVLGQVRRVMARPAAVVLIRSSRSAQQGNALAFRSSVLPTTSNFPFTPLPVGIHRTSEYLRRQLQLGTLR